MRKSFAIFQTASLWLFYGLLAYMPLHIFLSTWLGTSFGVLDFAKVAKDILLFAGFLFAFCSSLGKAWFKSLLRDKLVWLIGAYAGLTVLLALVKPTDQDAEILGLVYNLRFLLFFLYGLLLVNLFDTEKVQKSAVKIVLTVGALVAVFGLFQYFILPDDALTHVGYSRANGVLPVFYIDEKPDLERVMSTVRDPNSLGSYLIIVISLAAAMWLKQKDKRLVWAGLAGVMIACLWLTFSRSAWIGFVLAMGVLGLLARQPREFLIRYKTPLLTGMAAVLVLTLGGFYAFRDGYLVQNVVLHADDSTVLEDPNELRIKYLASSIEGIAKNPLGSGPGTAGLASIKNNIQGTILNENYYLQIATEVGIMGLILFLAILVAVGRILFEASHTTPLAAPLLAVLVGLTLTNLLVHIWSNEAVAYTWWGLAGLSMGLKKMNKTGDD